MVVCARAKRVAAAQKRLSDVNARRASSSSAAASGTSSADAKPSFDTSMHSAKASTNSYVACAKLVVTPAREAEIVHRLAEDSVHKHNERLRMLQVVLSRSPPGLMLSVVHKLCRISWPCLHALDLGGPEPGRNGRRNESAAAQASWQSMPRAGSWPLEMTVLTLSPVCSSTATRLKSRSGRCRALVRVLCVLLDLAC